MQHEHNPYILIQRTLNLIFINSINALRPWYSENKMLIWHRNSTSYWLLLTYTSQNFRPNATTPTWSKFVLFLLSMQQYSPDNRIISCCIIPTVHVPSHYLLHLPSLCIDFGLYLPEWWEGPALGNLKSKFPVLSPVTITDVIPSLQRLCFFSLFILRSVKMDSFLPYLLTDWLLNCLTE
jgi:hypothetical protein